MTGGLTLAGAVLMVAAVLLLAYWCSRFLGKSWIRAASGKNIRIIEQIPVGQEQRLLLLELQGKVYLVGATPAGIQILKELENGIAEAEAPGADRKMSVFADILKKHASLHQSKKDGGKDE